MSNNLGKRLVLELPAAEYRDPLRRRITALSLLEAGRFGVKCSLGPEQARIALFLFTEGIQ